MFWGRVVTAVVVLSAGMACAAAAEEVRPRPAAAYFVDTDARHGDARVSMVLRGNRVTSGYVLDEKEGCRGYPAVTGLFIDFANVTLHHGRFKDVDRSKGFYKDVVSGKVRGERVAGRVRSVVNFASPGPTCRFGTRFSLERVDRQRWRRYTRQERKQDPDFPGDHRVGIR